MRDINPHSLRFGMVDDQTQGILVYPRRSSEPRTTDLTDAFDCDPIEALPVYVGNSLAHTFHFYVCVARGGT